MPATNAGASRSIAARLRPDAVTLLLAAAALIGAALILAREVNYGVGANLDSAAYVSAARNAADGNGFVVLHNQSPYVNYPPLFPAALALGDLAGLDPLTFAGWLNAAAFGLAVFIASLWLRRRVQSRFILAWAVVALVIAPPLVYVGTRAVAEALFVLLTLLGLFALNALLERKPDRSLLVLAALLAGLALLTRWFGLPLVVTGAALLLLRRDAAFAYRFGSALLYSAIAMTPICFWLARNVLRIGMLSNHGDIPPAFSFAHNLSRLVLRLAETLFGWSMLERFIASRVAEYADGAGLIAAAVGAASLLAVGALAAALLYLKIGKPRPRWPRPPSAALALGLFAVVYAVIVTAAISYRGVESFGIRYWAPVYAPILLAAALSLDRVVAARRNRRDDKDVEDSSPTALLGRNRIAVAVAVVLVVWLLPQANLYAERFQLHLTEGVGITSKEWRESGVVRYLKANPPQGAYDLASNIRGELHLLVGLPATHHQIPCRPEDLRGLAHWMHSDGKDLYVIWSDLEELCIAPSEIEAALNAEVEAEFSDGGVLAARKPG